MREQSQCSLSSSLFMHRTLPVLALAVVILACIANRWYWYAPETAYRGYSPVGWVYAHEHPAEFTKNLPNGTEGYDRSAVMWVYLLAYRIFGIEAEHLVYGVIALEIIGLAWCYVRMTQTLINNAPLSLAVVIAMLAIASSVRNVSLSRFGTPFFEGQFYMFAEIARNMAVLAALRGRWLKCAAWLSLAMTSHVILGAIGSVFVAAIATVRWRHGERQDILRAAALLLVGSVVWIACFHQPATLFVDPVADDVWYAWTRFFNVHWYPWLTGVFMAGHDRWLLPFTTLLAAGALTWLHPMTRPLRWAREIAVAMAALTVLVVFAIVVSEQRWSTTLVKLALHRSADMMLSFALIYAVAGWWQVIVLMPLWRSVTAAYLLFASTWMPGAAAVPLAMHGLLVSPAKSETRARRWTWWCVALLPLLIALGYVFTGHGKPWVVAGYSGWLPLVKRPALVAPLLVALVAVLTLRARPCLRAPVLVLCMAGACVTWVRNDVPGSGASVEGLDFLATQRWARAHSPPGALFFVDPTIFYGWSDYSRRSSFGNIRDWGHRWAYNSRREWWQRGVERLALLGLSVDNYLGVKQGAARLNRDAQTRFYQADDNWRRMLGRDWGVDYFVLRRAPANNSQLPIVYQNKKFMVLAVGAP